MIDTDLCKKCGVCANACPGITWNKGELPKFSHICTGCGGANPVCKQVCTFDAIVPIPEANKPKEKTVHPEIILPEIELTEKFWQVDSIRVLSRGVGGQGILFLGKVLARWAQIVGYDDPDFTFEGKNVKNIIKGEVHGMAQLGGPVHSTFGCGQVYSPEFFPRTADVLIALEAAEVLRDGAPGYLKPGGIIILNREMRLPPGLKADDYPSMESILGELKDFEVLTFDGMEMCRQAGDDHGKFVNTLSLGLLSKVSPFDKYDPNSFRQALIDVSPNKFIAYANLKAFDAGRSI